MNSQTVLEADELQVVETEPAPPTAIAPHDNQDMTPGALKATFAAIFFSFLYLAVSAAWLWSAMYRYQNCL